MGPSGRAGGLPDWVLTGACSGPLGRLLEYEPSPIRGGPHSHRLPLPRSESDPQLREPRRTAAGLILSMPSGGGCAQTPQHLFVVQWKPIYIRACRSYRVDVRFRTPKRKEPAHMPGHRFVRRISAALSLLGLLASPPGPVAAQVPEELSQIERALDSIQAKISGQEAVLGDFITAYMTLDRRGAVRGERVRYSDELDPSASMARYTAARILQLPLQ